MTEKEMQELDRWIEAKFGIKGATRSIEQAMMVVKQMMKNKYEFRLEIRLEYFYKSDWGFCVTFFIANNDTKRATISTEHFNEIPLSTCRAAKAAMGDR